MKARPLTPKQQLFAEEYLVDLNATRAYRAAGYTGSDNVCASEGHKLLRNPKVQAAIQIGRAKRSMRTEITQDMVLKELARIGFSDIRNLFDDNGNLKHITMMDDASAASIQSIEVATVKRRKGEEGGEAEDIEVEGTLKVKLWDKRAALIDMGRHLGMFREKIDVTVKEDLADMLATRRRRAAARDA